MPGSPKLHGIAKAGINAILVRPLQSRIPELSLNSICCEHTSSEELVRTAGLPAELGTDLP